MFSKNLLLLDFEIKELGYLYGNQRGCAQSLQSGFLI